MKNQNRYAQLIEAQSPEPPEEEVVANEQFVIAANPEPSSSPPSPSNAVVNDHQMATTTTTTTKFNQDQDQDCSSSSPAVVVVELAATTGTQNCNVKKGDDQSSPKEKVAPPLDEMRKVSLCSSGQMSNSFASSSIKSTTGSDQHLSNGRKKAAKRSSGGSGSGKGGNGNNNGNQNDNCSLSSTSGAGAAAEQGSNTSGRGTNLTRTISRSMLELDQSTTKSDKFEVSWTNLSFGYKTNRLASVINRKHPIQPVLCDISGAFQSNQLIAVIGPSGCGKTTLLQFLAGNNPNCYPGKLNFVGLDEPKVAFIGQGDGLLPGLTARETLIYASRLQNAGGSGKKKKFNHQEHVQPILEELGLSECADRSVTKLSGGQAKRVTIAQELLYPTNLLILDEVTSGLDASTSYSIVKLLKQLVSDHEYPMSIVMSIHQPSAKLFSVFDQVYVMSEGCCLYEGSCKIEAVNSYLKQFNLECPKFHNIADYLIEVASDDLAACEAGTVKEQMIQFQRKRHTHSLVNVVISDRDQEKKVFQPKKSIQISGNNNNNNNNNKNKHEDHHVVVYNPTVVLDKDDDDYNSNKMIKMNDLSISSSTSENCEQRIPMLSTVTTTTTTTTANKSSDLFNAIERARSKRERPFWNHFLVHLSRSFVRIRRSYILTYLQLITYILLGLQLATFYGSNIGIVSGCPKLPMSFLTFIFSNDSEDDTVSLEMRRIQENMNFLLVACMTATFAALEITVITFPLEAKTVKREWRNGWYRVSSYFMGRTLADLPFQLSFVIAFCLVIYTLTGQVGLISWRFGSFVLIIIMTALIAQAVGFIFGAVFMNNLPAAVFTAPLCIFPALLFSGFFSRVSQIPIFYKPMTYLSHFRYAFDALLVTLYGFDRCNCDQAILATYHESLNNQTGTVKEVFRSLFGSVECPTSSPGTTGNPDENSIEDAVTPRLGQEDPIALSLVMNHITTTTTTTEAPRFIGPIAKSIEDALVDSVFEHMNRTTDASLTSSVVSNITSTAATTFGNATGSIRSNGIGGGPMDLLVNKFSSKVTSVLNSRSNFGHPMPMRCEDFNSYLMSEFDLHNDDLMFGLLMLFIFVIISRLLCNTLLSFTIASRS